MVLPQRAIMRAWEGAMVGRNEFLSAQYALPHGARLNLQTGGVEHTLYGRETEPVIPQRFPPGRVFSAHGVDLKARLVSSEDHRFLSLDFETVTR